MPVCAPLPHKGEGVETSERPARATHSPWASLTRDTQTAVGESVGSKENEATNAPTLQSQDCWGYSHRPPLSPAAQNLPGGSDSQMDRRPRTKGALGVLPEKPVQGTW